MGGKKSRLPPEVQKSLHSNPCVKSVSDCSIRYTDQFLAESRERLQMGALAKDLLEEVGISTKTIGTRRVDAFRKRALQTESAAAPKQTVYPVLSLAKCRDDPYNTEYGESVEIRNIEDLKRAAQHEFMCGTFKDSQRKNENFLSTTAICMACSNKGRAVDTWILPELLEEAFPGVHCYIVQDSQRSYPYFYTLFPLSSEISEAGRVKELKEHLREQFPFVQKAIAVAQRFSGFPAPEVTELNRGGINIDSWTNLNEPLCTALEVWHPPAESSPTQKTTPREETEMLDAECLDMAINSISYCICNSCGPFAAAPESSEWRKQVKQLGTLIRAAEAARKGDPEWDNRKC